MNPVALVLGVVALVVSAVTKLNAVVLGRPVSVPYAGIVAVLVALAIVTVMLWLIRDLARNGLRLRPVVVRT